MSQDVPSTTYCQYDSKDSLSWIKIAPQTSEPAGSNHGTRLFISSGMITFESNTGSPSVTPLESVQTNSPDGKVKCDALVHYLSINTQTSRVEMDLVVSNETFQSLQENYPKSMVMSKQPFTGDQVKNDDAWVQVFDLCSDLNIQIPVWDSGCFSNNMQTNPHIHVSGYFTGVLNLTIPGSVGENDKVVKQFNSSYGKAK